MNGDQENTAAIGTAETRFEEVDERHVNFAERDGFNFHDSSFKVTKFQGCLKPRRNLAGEYATLKP
jgi:hypothetical protein